MKTTVVGLGLIGGSLALDLRARGFASRIIGVDANAEHSATAMKLGLVDAVEGLEGAIGQSDLVILAVPVDFICGLLPQVLDLLPPHATVTDMGSTKGLICAAVAGHRNRAQFVPSHPMAGTENSGPTAAFSGLFDGKAAVICDSHESGAAHLKLIEQMFDALKMRRIYMTSREHDLHTAYVSHLSHISSFVLANTVLALEKNVNTIFDLAGGGFESTVRLAKSSPDMWAPIFEQNRGHVVAALASYIGHLQIFHQALVDQNVTATRQLMEDANGIRRVLVSMGARHALQHESKKERDS
jgi:prephenate dehydrogenase